MARIAGTFCSVEYTFYKDIIITMGSGTQKKQAAFIPTNANSSDYEYQITNLTSSGPLLQFGAVNTWITLPNLTNFDQTSLLYSIEVNLDESTPISSNTCWVQFTLTVRKKSNHLDYASGVIKLVPTLNIVGPPPPPVPLWDGQYTIGIILTYPAGFDPRVLKETFFNTDGTWSDSNSINASFNKTGRWLPAGANAANYSMRSRDVTTINNGSFGVTLTGTWQKMTTRQRVAVECATKASTPKGTHETRWYGIIDIRNDLTGKTEYSGWFYTRAIITLT